MATPRPGALQTLPDGRYLSCLDTLHPDHSGQTRATLMRNRLLRSQAGVEATVLTFDSVPDYDERRHIIVERGLVHPETAILNIFDDARERAAPASSEGQLLTDLSDQHTRTECRVDGSPWRIRYVDEKNNQTCFDYLRPDGTPCLRVPKYAHGDHTTWPDTIQLVSPGGFVVAEFGSLGEWFRHWIGDLTDADERAFIFVDSRYLVPHLVPLDDPDNYLIYVLHNRHVGAPGRWDAHATGRYEEVMSRISGMDAMVTLTSRQRADLAERCGETNNLFVVPNPVDMPSEPESVDRDPRLTTVLARLEPQKRLNHALAAFALVRQEIPDARLDIYGVGSLRARLDREIHKAGLEDGVTLRGFDPEARNSLWHSSAFLLTSRYEGYPLSTLESFSHACPVVSYDIKYGPREQIADGVDGFLVPDGDIVQLAQRVVTLLRDPDRVRRMGVAARANAQTHGPDSFIRDWADVLDTVIAQKAARSWIDEAQLDVNHLLIGPVLEFSATLSISVQGPPGLLAAAHVELSVVHTDTGVVVPLSIDVRRQGAEFQIDCTTGSIDVDDLTGTDAAAHLRLRLVLANSSWQTQVGNGV